MPGALIRHLKLHQSFARCSSPTQCRLQSTAVLKGDQLGPTHQDEHQSFRVRKEGKPLPLPPVLDPVVLAERSRWENTKAKPDVKKFTPFQKKLWENPYAHALASPVRQCRSTNLLLPSALLISLHPRLHPETSEPWLVPVGLTTVAKHLGVPYRFLGRKLIATQLGRKQQWKAGIYHRFTEKLGNKASKMVWREDMPDLVLSLLRKNLLNRLRWYFKQSGQLIPCNSPRSQDIEGFDDVSCVLYLGSLKTSADEIQARSLEITHEVEFWAKYFTEGQKDRLDPHRAKHVTHKPPSWYRGPLVPQLQPRVRFPSLEFNTTQWRGSRVAVYSLWDLLGEEKMEELVKGSRFEWERCLVMKRGRHNVPVELLLMQMQAFLATPQP